MGDGERVDDISALEQVAQAVLDNYGTPDVILIPSTDTFVFNTGAMGNVGTSVAWNNLFTFDPLVMPWNADIEEATTIRYLRTLRTLKLLPQGDVFNAAKQVGDFGSRMRGAARRNIKIKKVKPLKEHPFKKFQDPTSVGRQYSPRLKFKK